MKTYKVVFSSKSSISQIPDSQTLFGAICNIIKQTQGESQFNDYIASFKNNNPYLIHSSMFLNGFLPMIKKNIMPLDTLNQMISKTNKNDKLNLLNETKTIKRLSWMSERIFQDYFLENHMNDLIKDVLNKKHDFCFESNVLSYSSEKMIPQSKTLLLVRNGFPEANQIEKSLFYSEQVYFPVDTEFCVFVKTNLSAIELEKIFSYFGFLGVGKRRSVGLNVFKFKRIENVGFKSNALFKLILSKYIPNESFQAECSFYTLNTEIYRSSKDYVGGNITGKFTHIIEGSYLLFDEDKEYYGKVIETMVNGLPVYHYSIGFVI